MIKKRSKEARKKDIIVPYNHKH